MVKKNNRKKKLQKGGMEDAISWNSGGPGGSLGTLADDIIGTIIYTINSVVNAVGVVEDIIELPADMGTAFTETNAPNPDNVNITSY